MNILPTHPKYCGERYFADMERLRCDVAYTAYYAQTKRDVFEGKTGARYREFVARSHERGLPACIQVQSTLANLVDLDLAEAQRAVENTPCVFQASNVSDEYVCFASFASEAWKRLLMQFTEFFIQEAGFDWIVFEEPMFAVDIPGTEDRFYEVFRRRWPEAPYPARHEETPSYVKVQQLKKEVLADFYRALLDHAKAAGAKRRGLMPWFFTPIYENTPYETLDTACDLGRLIHLESLDFVVVRMQPDNIYSEATAPVPTRDAGPRLYYTEVMAHSLGKPVICVNNAINEHRAWFEFDAIPLEFFQSATLSAVAAAPEGMSHHWYVPRDLPHIEEHWALLARTNDALRRLGRPQTPVAFVYSCRGACHAAPFRPADVFERYWAFARRMVLERGPLTPAGERMAPAGGLPFKVFYADTLAASLARNPDVRLLVLDEYHPLTEEETALLERWLAEAPAGEPRAVLAFLSGYGYSADPERAGDAELHEAWPGLLRLCGFDPARRARPRILNRSRRILRRGAGAGLPPPMNQDFSAYVYRALEAAAAPGTEILLEIEREGLPYLTRARRGAAGGGAFAFCAGLWDRTEPPITPLVRWILGEIGARPVEAAPGPDTLWNHTANGYLIATNPGARDSYIDLSDPGARYWDVAAGRWLATTRAVVAARDFRLFRRVVDGQRALDARGAALRRLEDPPRGAVSRIELDSRGAPVELILLASPQRILAETAAGQAALPFEGEWMGEPENVIRIRLNPPAGETTLRLEW